jgi:hypothetical protein
MLWIAVAFATAIYLTAPLLADPAGERGQAPKAATVKAEDCCADPTCYPGCCPECPPDCCVDAVKVTKATAKAPPAAQAAPAAKVKATSCCSPGSCCAEKISLTAAGGKARAPVKSAGGSR